MEVTDLGAGVGGMGEGGKSEMDGMDVWEGGQRLELRGASTGESARAARRLLGVCGVIGRTVVIFRWQLDWKRGK
jgi:hypothetical protein